MNNLSIRIKLFVPLAVACVLLIVLLGTSFKVIKSTQSTSHALGEAYLPAVSSVLNADRDLYQARLAQLEFLYATGEAPRKLARSSFEENNQQAKDRMAAYRAFLANEKVEVAHLDEFDVLYNRWMEESGRFFNDPNISVYKSLDSSFEAVRDIYDKAGEAAGVSGEQLRKTSMESSDRIFITLSIVALITLGFLGVTTYVAPKLISERIQMLTAKVQDLGGGSGDLRKRLAVDSRDELGDLGHAFNELIDSIAMLVSGVRKSVDNFGVEVEQFFHSIEHVSQSTSEQSTTLSSLAASYHESATATEEVSGITQRTAELTSSAQEVTDKGVSVIQHNAVDIKQLSEVFLQTYSVADDLKQNSQQIASVMETIRSIAEQTNLLALNAAIEAARAGEQGRGFAVVADEVRTLASRTQESTDEIDQIVSAFQNQVANVFEAIKDGCDRLKVTESDTVSAQMSFQEIKVLVEEINGLSLQTAAATEQQTAVADEINRNISYIDERAQKNAENMEAAKAVAASFKSEAETLVANVSRFQVD